TAALDANGGRGTEATVGATSARDETAAIFSAHDEGRFQNIGDNDDAASFVVQRARNALVRGVHHFVDGGGGILQTLVRGCFGILGARRCGECEGEKCGGCNRCEKVTFGGNRNHGCSSEF